MDDCLMLQNSETLYYISTAGANTFYIDVKFTFMHAVSVLQILCLSLLSIYILYRCTYVTVDHR